VTPDELKGACLALPGAVEEFPFGPGVSVFKVAGKIFAISRLEEQPLAVSLRCDPELALDLRATYPAITGGYHLNKKHWNTVVIDGSVPDRLVEDMIEDSWDLVVASLSRKTQAALGARP
jgi:predicted DNA-binding protein (MmcQ/YjbR family)